ncbi:MAG: helix-turn-helix transcriptional regulator [Bacteroidales bacterium]|nr:helix-turn-helix transcriptional regulator [Bacteroidales bacterium]
MFKSIVKCGDANPVSMVMPSAGDIKGNPDTIFSNEMTIRDGCALSTRVAIHNQTLVMYNSYYARKACTIENSRTDQKALVFSVITSGKTCEVINGQQVEHGVGSVNMGIMSPESIHIMHLAAECRFEKISVMMSECDYQKYNEMYPVIFSGWAKYFAEAKPYVSEVDDSEGKILEAARELQNSVFSHSINPHYVEGLIVECIVNSYYRRHHKPLPDSYSVCRKIFKARDVLTENFQNPPTLRELAASVGTNECTLKKVFKQMFSITVFDYLNDLRMNKAARLLADGDSAINDIAQDLGFSSQSHFTTSFRKRYGLTPKEFREGKRELIDLKEK